MKNKFGSIIIILYLYDGALVSTIKHNIYYDVTMPGEVLKTLKCLDIKNFYFCVIFLIKRFAYLKTKPYICSVIIKVIIMAVERKLTIDIDEFFIRISALVESGVTFTSKQVGNKIVITFTGGY